MEERIEESLVAEEEERLEVEERLEEVVEFPGVEESLEDVECLGECYAGEVFLEEGA